MVFSAFVRKPELLSAATVNSVMVTTYYNGNRWVVCVQSVYRRCSPKLRLVFFVFLTTFELFLIRRYTGLHVQGFIAATSVQ